MGSNMISKYLSMLKESNCKTIEQLYSEAEIKEAADMSPKEFAEQFYGGELFAKNKNNKE